MGEQTGARTFTASNTLASNGGETETITVDHDVKTALGFSVGAAVRLSAAGLGARPVPDGRDEAQRVDFYFAYPRRALMVALPLFRRRSRVCQPVAATPCGRYVST